jgi:nitrite reductase (NADH) large subunit
VSAHKRLVVVGNGMAGARLVEELVSRGRGPYDVVMFGDEPCGNYNRILLSGILARSYDPKDIFINPLPWYAANGVTLHAGTRVERINLADRQVTGAQGVTESYDTLVLATGSRPCIPPIDGWFADSQKREFTRGAFVFRTLQDCSRMLAFTERARRAAVIGGGLLGLEAARGLLNVGLEVHVVHLTPHLMDAQLDRSGGDDCPTSS